MEKLLAYHSDPKIKRKYVARVLEHKRLDHIRQGVYYEQTGKDIKACAVGCTIEGSDHSKYETELGIPRIIARLEDRIFEGLSNGKAKQFPLKFLQAVNVGADLSLVWPKFVIWLLIDKKDGAIQYARPDGKKAIRKVAKLYQEVIDGAEIDKDKFRAAADAAAAAAADAASYAAVAADAAAAAADAAAVAAAVAAAAAAYAADAAAYAADAAAAAKRTLHYEKMADKLIELLKDSHAE